MLQSLYRRAIRHRTPAVVTQFGLARESSDPKRKSLDPDDPDAELSGEELVELNQDAFEYAQDTEEEEIKDSYCLTMTQQGPSSHDLNMSCFEEQCHVSLLKELPKLQCHGYPC